MDIEDTYENKYKMPHENISISQGIVKQIWTLFQLKQWKVVIQTIESKGSSYLSLQ